MCIDVQIRGDDELVSGPSFLSFFNPSTWAFGPPWHTNSSHQSCSPARGTCSFDLGVSRISGALLPWVQTGWRLGFGCVGPSARQGRDQHPETGHEVRNPILKHFGALRFSGLYWSELGALLRVEGEVDDRAYGNGQPDQNPQGKQRNETGQSCYSCRRWLRAEGCRRVPNLLRYLNPKLKPNHQGSKT